MVGIDRRRRLNHRTSVTSDSLPEQSQRSQVVPPVSIATDPTGIRQELKVAGSIRRPGRLPDLDREGIPQSAQHRSRERDLCSLRGPSKREERWFHGITGVSVPCLTGGDNH